VILFLDTEFTDLAVHARLLSIAMLGPAGSAVSFYGEVTDSDRIQGASWFAVETVLPQFGYVARAESSYAELCTRLCTFLDGLSLSLAPGEFIDIAFGYHLDWELLERAVKDGAGRRWTLTMGVLRPLNVYLITSGSRGRHAAQTYFETLDELPCARHHALCDAKALRLAYEAETQVNGVRPLSHEARQSIC
jgi:hypothetical protein